MRIKRSRLLEDRTKNWGKSYNSLDPILLNLEKESVPQSKTALRRGLIFGAILHVVIFMIVFPTYEPEPYIAGGSPKVYVMRQVKFSPPEAAPRRTKPIERLNAKRIPIPDPTPDDPEPFYDETVDGPEMEFPEVGVSEMMSIPDGPPGPSGPIYQIAGNVKAPVKIHAPDPVYPEEARLARIQGVVILQTIVTAVGKVSDIRVLKGLPSGLTESAIEAVESWEFSPATLEGKPVAVHYMITISFSVQ